MHTIVLAANNTHVAPKNEKSPTVTSSKVSLFEKDKKRTLIGYVEMFGDICYRYRK